MLTMWDSCNRYFKDVFPILRDMARRGIPIDEGKRQELKQLILTEECRVSAAIGGHVPDGLSGHEPKGGLKRKPKVECECGWEGREDHLHSRGVLFDQSQADVIEYETLAAAAGMIEIEVEIKEEEKCSCLKAERGHCVWCAGSGIIPSGSMVRRWARPVPFNSNSWQQVIRLIRLLGHKVPTHSKRTTQEGEPAETTEMKELERLSQKTRHPIYSLLIEKRMLTKTLGTYVTGWEPSSDGAIHTTYTFQTATWQTSSRSPNVQNGLKHGKTDFQKRLAHSFNSMQSAFPGNVLINFDFKSFHALTTAHDFNLPDYARLARIDIHSFVACQFLRLPECQGLWERDDQDMKDLFRRLRQNEEFAACRDVPAKQTILGIQFGRGPISIYTMYREYFESQSEAKAIHSLVYSLFPRLRVAQDEVKQKAAEDHRLVNKFGAIRHFWDVQRWDRNKARWIAGDQAEEAVAFLPASHAFGHVRDCLLKMREKGYDEKFGLCNSIHDSFLFHCPLALVEDCKGLIKEIMETPSSTLIYSKMAPNGLVVEAEATSGQSMAELH